jgi:DNA-3-methyladenine glycosylase II
MAGFAIDTSGPFALAAAAEFLGGFTPASGSAEAAGDGLALAFRLDGTWEPAGVALREEGARVLGEVSGTAAVDAARAQVARMLGLDVDGSAWAEVGRRDPVVGVLQARWPGFRAVAFPSPYEAAAWGILAQRVSMAQAAGLKQKIAAAHGDAVEVAGRRIAVFPSPAQLLAVASFPGLPAEKMARLHAVAQAALDGALDAARLRALPEEEALARLRGIPGVGEWTAGHILYRGAAVADALAGGEPRVLRGAAEAYRLKKTPSLAELEPLAEKWRPFRMWVCILLVRALRGTAGWQGPEKRGVRGGSGNARGRPRSR